MVGIDDVGIDAVGGRCGIAPMVGLHAPELTLCVAATASRYLNGEHLVARRLYTPVGIGS